MSSPQARRELADLLTTLFTGQEIRGLVEDLSGDAGLSAHLPEVGATPASVAETAVDVLSRRGLADSRLFDSILARRPDRAADITAVAERWRTEGAVWTVKPPQPSTQRRLAIVAAVAVALALVAWGTVHLLNPDPLPHVNPARGTDTDRREDTDLPPPEPSPPPSPAICCAFIPKDEDGFPLRPTLSCEGMVVSPPSSACFADAGVHRCIFEFAGHETTLWQGSCSGSATVEIVLRRAKVPPPLPPAEGPTRCERAKRVFNAHPDWRSGCKDTDVTVQDLPDCLSAKADLCSACGASGGELCN